MREDQSTPQKKGNSFHRLIDLFLPFIKFNIVGVLNTLVDVLCFTILIWFGAHYLAAQAIGYASGMMNSLFWNKKWTFQHHKKLSRQKIGLFFAINICTLLLSFSVLYLTIDLLHLPLLLGKLLAIALTVGINYWGSRKFVFHD